MKLPYSKSMKIPSAIFLVLILSSCGGDGESEAEYSLYNDLCESGTCVDIWGDGWFDFLDMGKLKISTNSTSVTVDMELLNIPPLFTYNSTTIPDGNIEYAWEVSFDVDFDNTSANDITLSINHFKEIMGVEAQGSILDFTENVVFLASNDGVVLNRVGTFTATQNANTLTFNVQKSVHPSVQAINSSTPFKFRTIWVHNGTFWVDELAGPEYLIPP